MIKMVLDIPPSVNHCYVNIAGQRKGRKLTEAAKNWKLLAGYEANQAKRPRLEIVVARKDEVDVNETQY